MMVLVDSSVWIEFFQKSPAISTTDLELLIEERKVVTCLPVMAEVLSGKMSSKVRQTVRHAFEAMTFVDLNWNAAETWHQLVDYCLKARRREMGIPGMVDRMIFAACQESGAQLWTLDKNLQRLALIMDQNLFVSG